MMKISYFAILLRSYLCTATRPDSRVNPPVQAFPSIQFLGSGRADEIPVEYAGIAGSGRPVRIPMADISEFVLRIDILCCCIYYIARLPTFSEWSEHS